MGEKRVVPDSVINHLGSYHASNDTQTPKEPFRPTPGTIFFIGAGGPLHQGGVISLKYVGGEPQISHLTSLPAPAAAPSINDTVAEPQPKPSFSIVPDLAEGKEVEHKDIPTMHYAERVISRPSSQPYDPSTRYFGLSLDELKERVYASKERITEIQSPIAENPLTEEVLELDMPSFLPPPPKDGEHISGYNFLEDIQANLAQLTDAESAKWNGMSEEDRITYLENELARRWKEGKSTHGEEFSELRAGLAELASDAFEKLRS